MDNDATRPFLTKETVLYRCSCGNQIKLQKSLGGTCESCQRVVSAKALQHDLAATITLGSDEESSSTGRNGAAIVNSFDPNELIGKSFGHFEIIGHLGTGGMGHVYRALDKSLQRYVAVKVLMKDEARQSPDEAERLVDILLQEAVAQARVQHPNIVTIYFVGKQNGEPFLAMELIRGDALNQKIEKLHETDDKINFVEISKLTSQIVSALRFSHELDVIHGDIKPSNILLDANGRVKLSDFGMARNTADTSQQAGGTPNYLAPEVLKGKRPSVQSDMYALGVTLYELTFGRLPVSLDGTTVLDWQKSHENAKLEFPSPWPEHLPDRWRGVLEKLLAPDPMDRYRNYNSLREDIDNLRTSSSVPAGPVPRMMAAFFDWATVILFMTPIQAVLEVVKPDNPYPAVAFLMQLVDLVPMIIYVAVAFIWRQSLGRRLMQIRVINSYGMVASSRTMALRSFPRMLIPYITAILLFVSRTDPTWIVVTASSIGLLAVLFWIIDTAMMLISRQGKSLHDIIFDTSVVLDTD